MNHLEPFLRDSRQKFKESNVTVEVQSEYFSVKQAEANTRKLYVFGDNLERYGEAGQACIRNVPNSIGLATKRAPGSDKLDYFEDSLFCYSVVLRDITKIIAICNVFKYKTIVFPKDGLGTGFSDMPNKCPELYKEMNRVLNYIFGVNYE